MKIKIKGLFLFFLFFGTNLVSQVEYITIQPGVSDGKDAMVINVNPSINYGNFSFFRIRRVIYSSWNYIDRGFIEMDLTQQTTNIPPNAIILDAKLKLYRYDGYYTSTSLEVNKVITPWLESTINWQNAPNVSNVDMKTQSLSTSNNIFHEIDVTSHVQEFVNFPNLNNGWRLKCKNETTPNGSYYRSSEDPQYLSQHPKLEISFVRPVEITANIINHSDFPTSNNGSISINTSGGDGTYYYQWIDGSTGSDISGETLSSINNLVPGWYGVKVTDGMGTISYMAFVVGAKCGEVTIDFQPDGRFVDDTHIITGTSPFVPSNYPNMNFGSVSVLYTNRYYSSNPFYDYNREFLFRNRIIIPNNIELNNTEQLFFGLNQSHDNTFGNESVLKNITEDWYEDLVTWNTKPTYGLNVATIPSTITNTENVSLDLTNVYRDYQNGAVVNRGHSVVLNYPYSNTNRKLGFASSDYTIASYRPKLVIHLGKICQEGYLTLKRSLDASYTFTKFGILHFSFDNDYEQMTTNDLSIKLFNDQRQEIALTGNEPIYYDDNRIDLDLNNLGLTHNKFYFIEVYLTKGERRYLRFQYKNS